MRPTRRLRLSQQSLRSAGFVLRLSALRQCNLICNTAFAGPTRFCNTAFACPTRFAVQLLSDQILQSLSNQTCNLVSPFDRICNPPPLPPRGWSAASRFSLPHSLAAAILFHGSHPPTGRICYQPCCRSRSSASGSKNPPRTTLYCRQADSAAADEKYFCAPVELDL